MRVPKGSYMPRPFAWTRYVLSSVKKSFKMNISGQIYIFKSSDF